MAFGNVLVTGGAGFLGSRLIKSILPMSKHIYVIDDLSTGRREAVPQSETISFYKDSITNVELLEDLMPKVEWVFHLACRNILLATEDLIKDYETNLYGGFLLLQKAKSHCPNLKKFVYTSTASVYGNAEILPTPESYHQITMPYPASKFSMEHYCQVFYHMYQLPVTILRLSNVFGPGQTLSNPYCGVVTRFFNAIQAGEPIPIYGNGHQTRDFTYIDDAMDAIILAADIPETAGKVYNVGTGKETSVNTLANKITEITGRIFYPTKNLPKRVIDKVDRRAVDISLIGKELDWSPRYTLEEGLALTYEWIGEQQVS